MSCHFPWLLYAEDVAEGWSHVSEDTVIELCISMLFAHIHEWHWVQRVRGVRRTIGVDSVVAVTVVSDDDDLVVVLESGLYHLVHAVVDGSNGFLNSCIYARVTHHIAVGEVEGDIVVLLCIECFAECFGYFWSRHLWLEVIGSHFW